MFIKTTLTIVTLTLLSCGSTEKQTTSTSETNDTISETSSEEITTNTEALDTQKMMAAGYSLGTIVYSDKVGDCPYTIKMGGDKMESYYLDPINLEESYKEDGQKVWIKFNGLRRMNRCENAAPVEITDIKKGE